MSDSNEHSQQFLTKENTHFSRHEGNHIPWVKIGPSHGHNTLPVGQGSFTGHPGPGGYHFQPTPYQIQEPAGTYIVPPPPPPPQYMHAPQSPGARPVARVYDPSGSTVPIDPVLSTPLPEDDDEDFPPPHKILPRVARPAPKVAGARHPEAKGKGKQRERDPQAVKTGKRKAEVIGGPIDAKKQKGRVAGTSNYTLEDIEGLLDILSVCLPLGGKAWNSAAEEFAQWAEENGRPARTAKSLELKFKQLVKTTKPTGSAECPPHIERAHEVEDAMNEKAGSRDLDDEDIIDNHDDAIIVSSDDEKENDPPVNCAQPRSKKPTDKTVTGPIARRPPTDQLSVPPRRSSRAVTQDFLNNISGALDPAAQAARAEDRTARSLQTSQIFSLTSQLRETQTLVESLRNRLSEADRERNAAERRADRAEMMSLISGSRARRDASPPRRAGRQFRQDVYFNGRSGGIQWLGSDDEVFPENDSPGTRRYCRWSSSPGSQPRREQPHTPSQSHPSSSGQDNQAPSPAPSVEV